MIKILFNNPFFNAIRNIKSVLDPDQKRRSIFMIVLMLVNAVFDVLGLATIFLLITSALEGDAITSEAYVKTEEISESQHFFNTTLRSIYQWSGAKSEIELLFYLSILIFVVFIIKNALSLWIVYIQTRFSYNIALRLNKKMFKYFYEQGYLFLSDNSSGKKVYKIVEVPMRFASAYLNPTFYFTTELVVITILIIALLAYNPMAVVLLMMVVTPVFVGIYLFSKNRAKEIGAQRNRLMPINYAKVIESMKAFVEVKLANLENKFLSEYEDSQKALNHTDVINIGIYQKIHQKTNDIIFGLGILVIFCYAFFSDANKESVLILLGFFGIAAYKVLPAINRMMNAVLSIKNSSFVIEELEILANQNLTPFHEALKIPFKDKIELKDLSFRYPESSSLALDHINLEIRKGESIGIIGGSGSGKTTLLKLILRLIKARNGLFIVDGKTIVTEEDEIAFQKNIGYVEQDVFILNGTLESNIAFGAETIDLERLNEAIENAMLTQFVNDQADGLKMQLGEGGVKLSGGQKQRVGIARALYKGSEILVFDEVTSALDPITERAIVESINHIASLGKTVIIVAHRITTLEKCNRIIELKEGKILGEREYSDLIKELVLHES